MSNTRCSPVICLVRIKRLGGFYDGMPRLPLLRVWVTFSAVAKEFCGSEKLPYIMGRTGIGVKFSGQITLIRASKQVHSKWYLETYPDVAALGMDAATHYLLYGAAMGRNPGKKFDTRFYQASYPDAAASNLNPVVHYVLHGHDKDYATRPPQKTRNEARSPINMARNKLLALGFTQQPLEEIRDIACSDPDPLTRAMAYRELALWHMRENISAGYRTAIDYIERAKACAPPRDFQGKLITAEIMCHYFLDDPVASRAVYDRAALAGKVTPDMLLAGINLEPTPEGRIAWINQVLRHYGISPVTLLPDHGQPLYDRLTSTVNLPAVIDEPKVTVLIAAYDAAEMLATALRSLQEQTWKNLEILVLDDCSPNPSTCEIAELFAASDPRIRLIRMEENGGAYVARNRGLDEATGEYVTIHDADDWSHPLKIETQVRFMQAHADVMGCTSEQARCKDDLSFEKLRGGGGFYGLKPLVFVVGAPP